MLLIRNMMGVRLRKTEGKGAIEEHLMVQLEGKGEVKRNDS